MEAKCTNSNSWKLNIRWRGKMETHSISWTSLLWILIVTLCNSVWLQFYKILLKWSLILTLVCLPLPWCRQFWLADTAAAQTARALTLSRRWLVSVASAPACHRKRVLDMNQLKTHDMSALWVLQWTSMLRGWTMINFKVKFPLIKVSNVKTHLFRDGPLENLWGGGAGEVQKKNSRKGKSNEKKFLHAN